MLRMLDSERISLIQEYCLERFGINHEKLENYRWYIGSKNRIYIGPEELKRIKPESIGLCVFRLDKTPKPTTNFLQLFGRYITKNIIELDDNETINYCSGKDLNPERELDVVPGFVIMRHKDKFLGCGHWNGSLLKNQIPKSRFCKINFL
jgi:hypothetical protein